MEYNINDIIDILGTEESLDAIIKYLDDDTIDDMIKYFIRVYDLDLKDNIAE